MHSEASILEGLVSVEDFAEANKTSPKTIRRRCHEPDGMPHTYWNGRLYVHVPKARDWLLGRIKQPNPRKGAR
jgi:hypothetical protein